MPAGPSMPDFNQMKEKMKKIEERVYLHDSKFGDMQTLVDSTSFNLKMLQITVDGHQERLDERKLLRPYRDSRETESRDGGDEGTAG